MIGATEWLVCAFASQERAKVCTSGNPLLFRRMDPRLRGGDKKRVIPAGLRHSREGGNPSLSLSVRFCLWVAHGQIKLTQQMYHPGAITS